MKFKTFLILINGFALFQGVIGLLGLGGVEQSIFGDYLYADNVENIAHTLVGLAGIAAAVWGSLKIQVEYGYFLAFFALIMGVISAFGPVPEGVYVIGAQLQNPGDTIIHLASGLITYYMTTTAYKKIA